MSVDQTQPVIDRYFEVMGAGGDFSQFYLDEGPGRCSTREPRYEAQPPSVIT